jgi:hypothetical protein
MEKKLKSRKQYYLTEVQTGRSHNERFGAMAGVARWIVIDKQQVKWLVASVCSPPLRQAATPLSASGGQRSAIWKRKDRALRTTIAKTEK